MYALIVVAALGADPLPIYTSDAVKPAAKVAAQAAPSMSPASPAPNRKAWSGVSRQQAEPRQIAQRGGCSGGSCSPQRGQAFPPSTVPTQGALQGARVQRLQRGGCSGGS